MSWCTGWNTLGIDVSITHSNLHNNYFIFDFVMKDIFQYLVAGTLFTEKE